MNTVLGCKQKTPVLDSALSLKDLKGSSHGRRSLSMSALSLNPNDDDDQNAGATDDDEERNRSSNNNNSGFSIFHGSDRYTLSSLSSSSSGNSLGSPLWSSSACTADSSPPCAARSLQAAVPFSWEDRPGVPNQQSIGRSFGNGSVELRPPPTYFSAGSSSRSPEPSQLRRQHQRPSSSGSGPRRPKKIDDPFLMAMVECTRQGIKDDRAQKQGYSCMKTCSVRDAQIAVPRSKAAFSDSYRDLVNTEASRRRHGVKAGSPSSKSEHGAARRQSPLALMGSEGNQGMISNPAHSNGDSLMDHSYYDNADLFKAGQRDFKASRAINRKKPPLTFVDWIRCADVELYQSLLHQ